MNTSRFLSATVLLGFIASSGCTTNPAKTMTDEERESAIANGRLTAALERHHEVCPSNDYRERLIRHGIKITKDSYPERSAYYPDYIGSYSRVKNASLSDYKYMIRNGEHKSVDNFCVVMNRAILESYQDYDDFCMSFLGDACDSENTTVDHATLSIKREAERSALARRVADACPMFSDSLADLIQRFSRARAPEEYGRSRSKSSTDIYTLAFDRVLNMPRDRVASFASRNYSCEDMRYDAGLIITNINNARKRAGLEPIYISPDDRRSLKAE